MPQVGFPGHMMVTHFAAEELGLLGSGFHTQTPKICRRRHAAVQSSSRATSSRVVDADSMDHVDIYVTEIYETGPSPKES